MRKIKVYAGLVCPRRSLDCKKLETYFTTNNCIICENPEQATDLILITCGFIERNIIESLKLIKKLNNNNARLIVGGCLQDIDAKRLKEHHNGPVFSTRNLNALEDFFPEFTIGINDIPDANAFHDYDEIDTLIGKREHYCENFFYDRYELEFKEKPFAIRIGYGCNSKCTYCSHRKAIGPYRDKDWDTCIGEFRKGCEQGYSIFKVTSMDTGRYGGGTKQNLPALLEEFLRINNSIELIIEDINPMWLIKYGDEIGQLCAKKKIRIIQTPIQSGSDAILKKMRRSYDLTKLKKVLQSLKGIHPELHIATELIIGFPTETEQDFSSTLHFMKDARIDFSYIYPYYENEHIDSRILFPKCSTEVINTRLDRIKEYFEMNKISYCIFSL